MQESMLHTDSPFGLNHPTCTLPAVTIWQRHSHDSVPYLRRYNIWTVASFSLCSRHEKNLEMEINTQSSFLEFTSRQRYQFSFCLSFWGTHVDFSPAFAYFRCATFARYIDRRSFRRWYLPSRYVPAARLPTTAAVAVAKEDEEGD